jgi:hypothetical protein
VVGRLHGRRGLRGGVAPVVESGPAARASDDTGDASGSII